MGIYRRSQEFLTESLSFPADVCKNEIKATIIGNEWAWIENMKGILEFTDKKLIIQGKRRILTLEGKRLQIDRFTKEELLVRGKIDVIRYSEQGGKVE